MMGLNWILLQKYLLDVFYEAFLHMKAVEFVGC